jgi:hypothetical protein
LLTSSVRLEVARRRLTGDFDGLKLAVQRLQAQGEVEVMLIHSSSSSNSSSSSGCGGEASVSAGGGVEVCVRLLGEMPNINEGAWAGTGGCGYGSGTGSGCGRSRTQDWGRHGTLGKLRRAAATHAEAHQHHPWEDEAGGALEAR